MPKYVITYQGSRIGVFDAETIWQAINTAYEEIRARGSNPDRSLIAAFPIRKKRKKHSV